MPPVPPGLTHRVWDRTGDLGRVHLGRNRDADDPEAEPELVSSGPYHFVRHPIYSGVLIGVLGTALATNPIGLIIFGVLSAYFYYSASVEKRGRGGGRLP